MKPLLGLFMFLMAVGGWVAAVIFWLKGNDHTALAWFAGSVIATNWLQGKVFQVKSSGNIFR